MPDWILPFLIGCVVGGAITLIVAAAVVGTAMRHRDESLK